MSQYLIHFDGSVQPKNPGTRAVWAYSINKDGQLLSENAGVCEGKDIYSSNLAEFHALYKALQFISENITSADEVFIHGDSQFVINMLSKNWKSDPNKIYYDSFILARTELRKIRAKKALVDLTWIPRELNQHADDLSKSI